MRDAGTALNAGASSGIGEAFATRPAHDGYGLIVVAVVADLSYFGDVARLAKRASSTDTLTLLINNAGYGAYRPFVELNPDLAESLVSVHSGALDPVHQPEDSACLLSGSTASKRQ